MKFSIIDITTKHISLTSSHMLTDSVQMRKSCSYSRIWNDFYQCLVIQWNLVIKVNRKDFFYTRTLLDFILKWKIDICWIAQTNAEQHSVFVRDKYLLSFISIVIELSKIKLTKNKNYTCKSSAPLNYNLKSTWLKWEMRV